jgi:hypothetical protein
MSKPFQKKNNRSTTASRLDFVKNLKGAIYINNAALSKNLLRKKNEKPNKRESFSEQLGLGRFISFYTLTK